jgi:hypothetical protein
MGTHVNLTIIGIPEDLLREFCEYVVKPFYEGDISEAIMDLMRKLLKSKRRENPQHNPHFLSQMKNSVESFNGRLNCTSWIGLKKRGVLIGILFVFFSVVSAC